MLHSAGNNVIAAAAQDSQSRGNSFETRSTGFTLDSDAFYDTTGANDVNAANTTATPIAGTGPQPSFMLDVAAIGGMYAGHIFIVSTEAGLGTRNAGAIGASAGEVVLLANGWVTNTGAIQAAGKLQINASGGISNTGPGAVISAQGNTSVTTDGSLTNTAGASLNNTAGLISAGNTATLQDTATVKTLAISNTGGTVIAGQTLAVNAASLGGDGKLLSQQDLSLALTRNFTNTGEVIANRDATLTTLGDISNSGKLQAGRALSATAQNINNTALGEISAVNTIVTAGNTLTNRGLIDGVETRINAATLSNTGTGRIYGDHLAIAATTLNNDTETVAGVRSDAVIAARERLDIAVQTLNNREHALVFSAGTGADALNIGGSLDASGQAIGQAGTANNNSATIESLGGLNINAAQINNTNEHFSTEFVQVGGPQNVVEYTLATGDVYKGADLVTRHPSSSVLTWNCEARCVTVQATGDTSDSFVEYGYTRVTHETTVATSEPGKIVAGGAISLTADTILNDKSYILAGGALNVSATDVQNTTAQGQRSYADAGTATYYWRIRQVGWDTAGSSASVYNPPDTVQAISLNPTRFEANAVVVGTGTTLNNVSSGGVSTSISAAGSYGAAGVQTVQVPGSVPTTRLFRLNPNPGSSYLVETDPRFANYKTWLGSDYMLQRLSLDPTVTQKRLGDGFYEQKLIREQVAQLTGQRFLADYSSDEVQYQALMNAGVTYAQQYNLRPGIALSALQMAQLTSDIVWLVEQEITLPDGSKQKALVPQVYARLKEGDLSASGALMAGQEVNIDLRGDLTSNGTIAGRQIVKLTAQNLNNLGGRIQGEAVSVAARNDLNNIGGQINAASALSATAGCDLNVVSTSQTASRQTGANSFSRTSIDRVAGLYVSNPGGTLVASAGRNANIIGSVIQNSGQEGNTSLSAANNLNLGAVATSTRNVFQDATRPFSDGGIIEAGNQITTGGALRLAAGKDLTAQAAQIQAGGALIASTAGNANIQGSRLTAGEISLAAGQRLSLNDGQAGKLQATRGDLSLSADQGVSLGAQDYVSAGRITVQSANGDITLQSRKTSDGVNTAIKGASLIAGQNVELDAKGTLRLDSTQITTKGQALLLGGSVQLNSDVAQKTDAHTSNDGLTSSRVREIDQTVQGTTVNAQGITVIARDGGVTGSSVTLDANQGDLGIYAKSGIDLSTRSEVDSAYQVDQTWGTKGGQTAVRTASRQTVVTNELSGKNVTLMADADISLNGTNIRASGTATLQGTNVNVSAATQTDSSSVSISARRYGYNNNETRQTLAGGMIDGAEGVNITATGITSGPLLGAQATPDGNVQLAGARITSQSGAVTVNAANNVLVSAVNVTDTSYAEEFSTKKRWSGSTTTTRKEGLEATSAVGSTLQGKSVTVLAGNNVVLEGTQIQSQGDALVYAGNQLIAAAAHDSRSQSSSVETIRRGLSLSPGLIGVQFGARGGGTANTLETTTARGVNIASTQGNASLVAVGTVTAEGVQVSAPQGTASIIGANVLIQAGVNTSSTSTTTTERGAKINAIGFSNPSEGIGRKLQETKGLEQTSLARSTLTGQNVNITATAGDARIAGTTVTTPGTLSLSAAGTLHLDGQQTETVSSFQSFGKDLMYQKMRDQGSIEQTTQYNQFNAGLVQFSAPKITAQIGSKDSAQQLAQQPGMDWVGQLLNDPALAGKVNWTTIEDASKNWDYKKQGLTPEGAAVVTIVVAFFTYGAASGAGGAVASGVGATGTTATVVAGATTAALTTLASQAAVSLINNQGDIGKVLEDLGSSQNIKSLLTAMVTAGALQGMGLNPNVPGGDLAEKTFSSQLWPNLKAGVARSLISTAINGGSLEDSLKANLTSAFIDTAAAQGANWIGDAKLDNFTNKMAHALAGCAAGAARVGGEGCAAGAIGAAIGEMAAEAYGVRPDTAQFAGMIGAIAAAVAGGNAEQINLASQAGANAAANNYLNHVRPSMLRLSESEQYEAAVSGCRAGDMAACNTRDELAVLSLQRDRQLAQACSSQPPNACNDLKSQAINMGNKVFTTASGYTYAVSPTLMALNPSTIGPVSDPRTGTFHDAAARSLAEGLLLETGNQVLGAALGIVAREAILAGRASMNVTVEMLENMALRNLQVGAISNLRTAETVNATMRSIAGWEPAWQSGTVVADVILKPGSRVSMVVNEKSYRALTTPGADTAEAFGGWATYDNVANQAYARNQLAITKNMKADAGYVVEVEITRPVYAQVGVVGEQIGAAGGGNQLHFVVPPGERASTFKVVGARVLP